MSHSRRRGQTVPMGQGGRRDYEFRRGSPLRAASSETCATSSEARGARRLACLTASMVIDRRRPKLGCGTRIPWQAVAKPVSVHSMVGWGIALSPMLTLPRNGSCSSGMICSAFCRPKRLMHCCCGALRKGSALSCIYAAWRGLAALSTGLLNGDLILRMAG